MKSYDATEEDKIKISIYKEIIKNIKKDCIAVPEVSITGNIADILVSNGHIKIYEIKSKNDSLKRLPKQVETFKKYSNYLTIVAHEKFIKQLLELDYMNNIGIKSIDDTYKLTSIREAIYSDMRPEHYLAYYNSEELKGVLRGIANWHKMTYLEAEERLLRLLNPTEIKRLTLFRLKEKYSSEFLERKAHIKTRNYNSALSPRIIKKNTPITPLCTIPFSVFKDFY
jgi:hypothetical protein